jgi:hypothetical protein
MITDSFDPSVGPEFVVDPYPTLERLREAETPIHRILWHGAPIWLVTRMADADTHITPNFRGLSAPGRGDRRAISVAASRAGYPSSQGQAPAMSRSGIGSASAARHAGARKGSAKY